MNGQRSDCRCRICRTRADRSALELLMLDLPMTAPARVYFALGALNRTRSAYRILTTGGSAAALGLALKQKTKALIRHDRILRCEVHQ